MTGPGGAKVTVWCFWLSNVLLKPSPWGVPPRSVFIQLRPFLFLFIIIIIIIIYWAASRGCLWAPDRVSPSLPTAPQGSHLPQDKTPSPPAAHKTLRDLLHPLPALLSALSPPCSLCSSHTSLLAVPPTCQAWCCPRAFVCAVPSAWNAPPTPDLHVNHSFTPPCPCSNVTFSKSSLTKVCLSIFLIPAFQAWLS